jgi:hypothetical protein
VRRERGAFEVSLVTGTFGPGRGKDIGFPGTGLDPSVLDRLYRRSLFKPDKRGWTTFPTTRSSLSMTGRRVSCTNLGHFPDSIACSSTSHVSQAA